MKTYSVRGRLVGACHGVMCCIVMALGLTTSAAWGKNYLQHPQFQQFLGEMEQAHHWDRMDLIALFSEVDQRDDIIALMERPAEKTKTWSEYRPIFINETSVKRGLAFWAEHEDVLAQAAQTYRVPAEIMVAIIGVETRYGNFKGKFPVIEALSTLAFSYPPRSAFFRNELEQFLVLNKARVLSPNVLGSYAGAMGYPQFIPSSYRQFAVDFDRDGKVDLINSVDDAVGSVGNYFHRHGWQAERVVVRPLSLRAGVKEADIAVQANRQLEPTWRAQDMRVLGLDGVDEVPGKTPVTLLRYETDQGPEYWAGFENFYVITRYNRSRLYAMAVYQLAETLRASRKVG
ncbi:MAG: lytic murein transglycosylase B [Gammaproteobacteria bacterium]